jgi:hypothetical protein
MAWSYVASAQGYYNDLGNRNYIDCSSSLNVVAGDRLVAWVAFEDNNFTVSSVGAKSGNVNTMTVRATNNSASRIYGAMAYKIAADQNATATFRGTLSDSLTWANCRIVVMQFRPDAGDTVAVDDLDDAPGTGSSSTALSGTIDTTGNDEVVIGASSSWDAGAPTSEKIGGTNADGAVDITGGDSGGMWYRILTEAASTIAAQATVPNTNWVCNIISFKSAPVGGSVDISVSDTLSTSEALD